MRNKIVNYVFNKYHKNLIQTDYSEDIFAIIILTSKGNPNAFFIDKQYCKKCQSDIYLQKLSFQHQVPIETYFTRIGLCGICLYDLFIYKIQYTDLYNIDENIMLCNTLLKEYYQTAEKYLLPYKRSKKLKEKVDKYKMLFKSLLEGD